MNAPSQRKLPFLLCGFVMMAAMVIWISARKAPPEQEFVTLSGPRDIEGAPGQMAMDVTNRSDRQVLIECTSVERKCNGEWESHFSTPYSRFAPGGPPVVIAQPRSLAILEPGAGTVLRIERPRNITLPLGTTAWRVAVSWIPLEGGRLERWGQEVIVWAGGTNKARQFDFHTNFTAEFKLSTEPR